MFFNPFAKNSQSSGNRSNNNSSRSNRVAKSNNFLNNLNQSSSNETASLIEEENQRANVQNGIVTVPNAQNRNVPLPNVAREPNLMREELEMPRLNLNMIKGNFSDKHHYFIGSIINREYIRPLINLQKSVKNQAYQNQRWNVPMHTRFVYLGYIDSQVAHEMMTKIFHPLCLAIVDKYKAFDCNYQKVVYRSKPPKNMGTKIISLQFADEENIIYQTIVPFLKKEGLRKIYDVESKKEKPHIDLLYLNCPDDLYQQSIREVPLPSSSFKIDHLCLIKGTPFQKKFGTPSKYDRLNIETVREFYYQLEKRE